MVAFDVSETRGPWVVFAPRDSEVIRQQLRALEIKGGRTHHFQAADLQSEAAIFGAFAEKLDFPGYFGRNWDAMVDCLDDLCVAVTGGVGVAGVVHDADLLVDAEFLRLFVSVLCQGADRANSDVDLDGDPLDRPSIVEHFVFLLNEIDAGDFVARIEHPDLVVAEGQEFVTVTLNPEVWFA